MHFVGYERVRVWD